jgi:transposase
MSEARCEEGCDYGQFKYPQESGVEELIRGTGARILYLPVYAPELNPIEMMWSVLKHFIRQLCRIGKYSMEQIVKTSLLLINPSSFRSWFAKCCYCTP